MKGMVITMKKFIISFLLTTILISFSMPIIVTGKTNLINTIEKIEDEFNNAIEDVINSGKA